MPDLPSASTRIRAFAGWLVLLAGLSATCLLFAERLGAVRLSSSEPAIGKWTSFATAAFGEAAALLLPLAIGHFLGLGVLWFTFFSTASVPRRVRQVARLGAAGTVVLIGANVSSTIESLPILVAHGANLTFWLFVECNPARRRRWDHPRRALDPLLSYGTSVAAVVAVMIAVERGQELQSAGNATAPAESTPSFALHVPARPETEAEAALGGGLEKLSNRRSRASSETVAQDSTPAPEQATAASLDGLFSERLRRASRAATVRVVNHSEQLTGSGTIVLADRDFACVLTASHLVRFGDEITVDAFDSDQLRIARSIAGVQVWGLDPRNDLAMLWVPGEARLRAAVKICAEPSAPAAGADVPVLALTCAESGPPAFYFETVTQRAVRKRATAEPVEIWEGARLGFRGQSGGALIDQRGCIVGVRSGIAGGKAYYAHHSAIYQFLHSSDSYGGSAAFGGPTTHADLLRSLFDPESHDSPSVLGVRSSKSSN